MTAKRLKFEVEAKFRVTSADRIRQQITAMGSPLGVAVRQRDLYFAHPCRDFMVTDEALRIRVVGSTSYVTYKGPKIDAVTKTRREFELPLADTPQQDPGFVDFLLALGFTTVAEVAKQRQTSVIRYAGREMEIALDNVDQLGFFVELETAADDANLEEARAAVRQLADELGLTEGERRSYLELILER